MKLHYIIIYDSDVSPISQSSILKVYIYESPLPKYSASSHILFVKVTFEKLSSYKSFLNMSINLTIKSLLLYLLFDKFNSFTLNYSFIYRLKLETCFLDLDKDSIFFVFDSFLLRCGRIKSLI